MLSEPLNLFTLFLSAFISATLLPGGSEVVLSLLHQSQQHSIITLLTIATLGNTLGGMTSYGIGRLIIWKYPHQSLSDSRTKAIARIRKWGSLALLFSWLPVIGDPLCVAAGYLKIHPVLACTLFAIGKLLRYIVVLWIADTTIGH